MRKMNGEEGHRIWNLRAGFFGCRGEAQGAKRMCQQMVVMRGLQVITNRSNCRDAIAELLGGDVLMSFDDLFDEYEKV